MSERPDEVSPWGTPPRPPASPAGPPPPPYGGPPSGGSPYARPAYGGPPGPPGYPPPPPPGRGPRRTGLLVGIAALVLVVLVAAGVVAVVLLGGDDADPAPAAQSPSASPTASPSAEPTEDVPTDDTDPADGDQVTGTGYTYRLPGPGWRDLTADKASLPGGEGLDTAVVLGRSFDLAQSSIFTESFPAPGVSDPDDLAPLFERNLAGDDGARPEAITDGSLAGERAIGFRIERLNDAGVPIVQLAYLAVHEEQQYSIGLTYPASGDTVSVGDFQRAAASWTWDD